MTLSSLVRVLWRQRVLVIPAACIAILLCVAVVAVSPPTYRASGSVVLLNPPPLPESQTTGTSIPADRQNPYARIGSLTVVGDLMVRLLGSDAVGAKLEAKGFDGTMKVVNNADLSGSPIVDLAAEAPTSKQAIADVNLLITEFNDQLQTLQNQQGTAADYQIRSETVIEPDRATTVFSGTLRLLLLTMFFGAGLVLVVGLFADRVRSEGLSGLRLRALLSRKRTEPDAATVDVDERIQSAAPSEPAIPPRVHPVAETPPATADVEATFDEMPSFVPTPAAATTPAAEPTPDRPARPARPRCEKHKLFVRADGTCSRCRAEQRVAAELSGAQAGENGSSNGHEPVAGGTVNGSNGSAAPDPAEAGLTLPDW